MLREHAQGFRRLMMLADIAILSVVYLFGCKIMAHVRPTWPLPEHQSLWPVWVLIWLGALHYMGVYDPFRVKSIPRVVRLVCQAGVAGFLLFSTFAFASKATYVSRLLTSSVFAASVAVLSLERAVLMMTSRRLRSRGHNQRHLLIVGTGRRAQQFIQMIDRHREWGLHIIGLLDDDVDRKGQEVAGYPVLGTFIDTPEILHKHVIDEVAVLVPRSWLPRVEIIMHECEREGVRMHMAVDYVQMRFAKARQNDLDGFPLLTFETTSQQYWHLQIKRLCDIALSAAALLVLAPFFALLAALIKLTSRGPVFFKQQRAGLNGRKFVMYKFRTMTQHADAQLEALLKERAMLQAGFKVDNDPRLTFIGQFLRKASLDELPQLWNVLKGDMSLVGPRPAVAWEVDHYESWHRRRLRMRPGLTCLWQISGRSRITDFGERVQLDLDYIDHWCLSLDWKIMARTVPVVLFGIGAK